jgi:hypothetical protein
VDATHAFEFILQGPRRICHLAHQVRGAIYALRVVDKVWVGVDESAQFHNALDTLQVTAAGLVFRICECGIRGSGCGACDAEMAEYRALGMRFADWGLVDQVEREPGAAEWNFCRMRNSTRVELFQGEKFCTSHVMSGTPSVIGCWTLYL